MPDHMLSYKQCTVLVFAGKLMWLSVYFNTNRRSLYTAFKEWTKKTCFHVTVENVHKSFRGKGRGGKKRDSLFLGWGNYNSLKNQINILEKGGEP